VGPRPSGKLANLLLAGVGRAGSTSLFWYLSQHPDVCPSSRKEPRYFLPLSESDEDVSGVLPPIEEYERCFAHCSGERYRMEATPGYFHGGRRLIEGVKATLDRPRIVLMLRDPVTRVWSIYRYASSHLLLPENPGFEEYIQRCEEVYGSGRLRPKEGQAYWSVRASHYVDYIEDWLDAFGDDVTVLFFEDLVADPRGVVERLCGWLGIDRSCVRGFDYSVENRSIRYRSRMLQRMALAMNSERFFRKHRRLKERLRRLYFVVNESAGRDAIPLEMRQKLQARFRPANNALAIQLARRGYTDFPTWLAGDGADANAG
jgi:Sulfotransferase domain